MKKTFVFYVSSSPAAGGLPIPLPRARSGYRQFFGKCYVVRRDGLGRRAED